MATEKKATRRSNQGDTYQYLTNVEARAAESRSGKARGSLMKVPVEVRVYPAAPVGKPEYVIGKRVFKSHDAAAAELARRLGVPYKSTMPKRNSKARKKTKPKARKKTTARKAPKRKPKRAGKKAPTKRRRNPKVGFTQKQAAEGFAKVIRKWLKKPKPPVKGATRPKLNARVEVTSMDEVAVIHTFPKHHETGGPKDVEVTRYYTTSPTGHFGPGKGPYSFDQFEPGLAYNYGKTLDAARKEWNARAEKAYKKAYEKACPGEVWENPKKRPTRRKNPTKKNPALTAGQKDEVTKIARREAKAVVLGAMPNPATYPMSVREGTLSFAVPPGELQDQNVPKTRREGLVLAQPAEGFFNVYTPPTRTSGYYYLGVVRKERDGWLAHDRSRPPKVHKAKTRTEGLRWLKGLYGLTKNPRKANKPKRKPAARKPTTKRLTKASMAPVVKAFERIQDRAKAVEPELNFVKLVVRAGIHDSPRHYAETNGKIIYVAPELASQPASVINGVLMHEFGHAYRMIQGKPAKASYDAEEREVDKAAERIFGKRIYYDKRGVETTAAKGNKRPRPAGLR